MTREPTLVVMAAGMGSRYGGLKQLDPMDEFGSIIMDFSVYDALRAGFTRAVFIIKEAFYDQFRASVGDRIAKKMDVEYVFQDVSQLPQGYSVPEGRVKPWGTAHALMCLKGTVNGPFVAVNADDYYGTNAFKLAYDYLSEEHGDNEHAMVAYELYNTLTDHGSVSRGVCEVHDDGRLESVTERLKVVRTADGGAAFTEDGVTFTPLAHDMPTSMNFWCFNRGILPQLRADFPAFLDRGLAENPIKCEYLIPSEVAALIRSRRASVEVLSTPDAWCGVTYPEDKPLVVEAIRRLRAKGLYPNVLFE